MGQREQTSDGGTHKLPVRRATLVPVNVRWRLRMTRLWHNHCVQEAAYAAQSSAHLCPMSAGTHRPSAPTRGESVGHIPGPRQESPATLPASPPPPLPPLLPSVSAAAASTVPPIELLAAWLMLAINASKCARDASMLMRTAAGCNVGSDAMTIA